MALQTTIPPIDFFNPRSVAVFVCILQGAIFAVLLLFRWLRLKKFADFWLAVLLVSLILSLVTPFIGFANVYDNNQWLTYFPFAIAYSYGALVWLYTASLLEPKRGFRTKDLAFFIPSAIYIAFRLFLFSHDLEWKGWFGKNYGSVTEIVVVTTEFVWNIFLLGLSIRLYLRYRHWLDDNFSDTEKIKLDWLRNFLYVFAAIVLLGAAFDFVNGFIVKLSYIQYFYFQIVLALATYGVAIAGYLRSDSIGPDFSATEVSETPAQERREPVPASDLETLKRRLTDVFEIEHAHRDPQLTLTDLARKMAVNTSALSYAINTGFGKNFNDFVNEYRIGEVKQRLAADSSESVLTIAFECGFNSKATFNRAFRKFTGLTPKEFKIRTGS